MPDDTVILNKTPSSESLVLDKEEGESHFMQFSGRFWIALIFSVGFVFIVAFSFFGKVPDATIFAGFASTAGMVVGNYMGQNKNQQKPSTTVT
jgi:hypothetical protein